MAVAGCPETPNKMGAGGGRGGKRSSLKKRRKLLNLYGKHNDFLTYVPWYQGFITTCAHGKIMN